MKSLLVFVLTGGVFLFSAEPDLALRGKSLFSADLKTVPKTAKAGKGDWQVKDGALVGAEKSGDKHAATFRMPFAFQDAVIVFEYKFTGGKAASFSINDEKEHVARLSLTQGSFQARKDDHDHGGPDKAVPFQNVTFRSGDAWQTATLQIVGDEIFARIGDQISFGSDELLRVKKAIIGFTVNGEGVAFRNLEIFEAAPNPEWAKVREELKKKYPVTAPAAKTKS